MEDRIFAIGDVHGCRRQLVELLARLPLDRRRDTIVFLGDYLDRGPDGKGVVETVCRLQDDGVRVVPLLGNHEYLLLEYHRSRDPALLPLLHRDGLEATLASYGAPHLRAVHELGFLPDRHRELLFSLLPYWETPDFIFVHAGLVPGLPLAEHDLPSLCETRGDFLTRETSGGKRVIFGHTPFATPLVTPTRIGIDTGAVYGNLLTAVELPRVRFFHA
ncbi:MAG: metallophosphoesterase [Thermodesulfobacteriota bacterium]